MGFHTSFNVPSDPKGKHRKTCEHLCELYGGAFTANMEEIIWDSTFPENLMPQLKKVVETFLKSWYPSLRKNA